VNLGGWKVVSRRCIASRLKVYRWIRALRAHSLLLGVVVQSPHVRGLTSVQQTGEVSSVSWYRNYGLTRVRAAWGSRIWSGGDRWSVASSSPIPLDTAARDERPSRENGSNRDCRGSIER
jgi:hypothetical protein